MVMVNREGQIVLVNYQTEVLFGYSRDELLGHSVDVLVPERFRGRHPLYRTGFFADPRARPMGVGRDLFGLRKDGSEVPIEIGLNPMRTEEGDFVLVAIADITERRRAEERFRLAVESAPNAMLLVDRQAVIVLTNMATEKVFGYRRDELLGQRVDVLVPERFRSRHPEMREGFFHSPQSRPMGAGRELYGLRKDGTEIPIEIGLNPLSTAEGQFVLASVMDITERRRAQQLFRTAVESAPNAMVMVDRSGCIVLVNDETQRLFGYPREELLEQPIELLVPPCFRRVIPANASTFFEGLRQGRWAPDETCLDCARTVPNSQWRLALIPLGRRKASSCLLRSWTLPSASAPKWRFGARTPRSSNGSRSGRRSLRSPLTSSNASPTRLPMTSAPLRAVHRFSELLMMQYRELPEATAAEYLRKIASGAKKMDCLIEDLLAYSKIGRGEIKLELIDVSGAIREAVASVSVQIQDSSADLKVFVDGCLRATADRFLLAQVLTNLLTNALKFMPPERQPRIEIATECREDRIRIWVKDNGIGIEPEYRDRMFKIFERLHGRERYPGTGIGLAIVSKAVDRMGGDLGFESQTGEGSRFWVELKRASQA